MLLITSQVVGLQANFHTGGPATEKLLSPKVLWVRDRKHVLLLAEWRFWRPRSTASWMSAARYVTVRPDNDWCTRQAILNSIRRQMASQCSCCSTGVINRKYHALPIVPPRHRKTAYTSGNFIYGIKLWLQYCEQSSLALQLRAIIVWGT